MPGAGDVAFANGNTVLVSDARTVQAVANAAETGIAVGGTFSLLNGCNLTGTNANGVIQGATATSCITTPGLGVGSSATVAASVTNASNTANSCTITHSAAGTLALIGNFATTGAASNVATLRSSGSGTLNLTGTIAGPSAGLGSPVCFSITGNGTVNIAGDITGGSLSNAPGLSITGTGANITVTGSVTGNSGPGIVNNAAATLTVNGACRSSATQPAIALGSASQITQLSGPFLLSASGNINPVQAASWRWAPTLMPTFMEVAQSNGSTKRNLYTADNMPTGGYPVAANVRQSTVYGPSNEFTGTLTVPAASSVAAGVPVDNSVGTAVLTLGSLGLATGNLDAQLANKATVDQVAAIVQEATSA